MGYVKQHLGVKLKRKSPVRQNHEDHMGHYSPLFLLVIDAQGNLLILTFHTHLHMSAKWCEWKCEHMVSQWSSVH